MHQQTLLILALVIAYTKKQVIVHSLDDLKLNVCYMITVISRIGLKERKVRLLI
jgi:hypothetical protein